MIFMCEWGAEEGHDPISHYSVDHAFIVVHCFQHIVEDGVEESLRLFWISICYYFQRPNDVCKQDSDLLAFALKIGFRC